MKEALATLSPEQRAELQDHLDAIDQGVTVQELRAIHAALDEELSSPSPGLTLQEARANLRSLKPGDAA